MSRIVALLLALIATAGPVLAQQPNPAGRPPKPDAGGAAKNSPFAGLGGNSKEPIKIDADKLEVFDRDNRAVYSGNVIAVQGETTMRCTALTILFERQQRGGGQAAQPQPERAAQQGGQNESIRQIDCAGPVTVVSKDQVATGDKAVYERDAGRVVMTGNVALSQGPNVARGERLVYDLNAGEARVETKPGGRVRSLFVPGSEADPAGAKPGTAKPGGAKPDGGKPAPQAGRAAAPTN